MADDSLKSPTQEGVTNFLLRHWPIVLAIFAITTTAVRSDAKSSELERRLEPVERSDRANSERLARIETELKAQGATLTRIEKKLDERR